MRSDEVIGERAVPAIRRVAAIPAARTVEISVVIVTWNSERWIERCLAAIPAACGARSYEILVHDNASIDRTVLRIDEEEADVIRSKTNDGFAGGVNRSIARSNA